MSNKEKRGDLATKVMELLKAEGMIKSVAFGSLEESMDNTQDYIDALTMVSAKIIASHLMKHVSEGVDPFEVTRLASIILDTSDKNLHASLDFELTRAIEKFQEIVEQELNIKPKNNTSH